MEQAINGLLTEDLEGVQFLRRIMCVVSTFLAPEDRNRKNILEHAMKYTDRPEILVAYRAAMDEEEAAICSYITGWR